MFTVSNILSLMRAPLAFLFLIERTDVRVFAIITAMLTDWVDGYLARKYRHTTRFGAILDPLMDKFFVATVLLILLFEHSLTPLEALIMVSRDIALLIFGLYLLWKKQLKVYNYRAILWGKLSTLLQFFVLLSLALKLQVSLPLYIPFLIFGLCILFELFFTLKTNLKKV